MQQSRLIRAINNLSSRQQEQFRNFVISPYFNQHEKTIELLEIIQAELKKKEPNLDREAVFKKLFPKQEYEEQKIHNVMSYLMRLYHKFLAHEHFENQQLAEQLFTLEEAYETGRWDVFKNRAKFLEKTLEQHPSQDSQYHYVQYRFSYLRGNYRSDHIDRAERETFQQMLIHLDHFYLVEKLKYSCILTAHEMVINASYDFQFLDETLRYLSQNWERFASHPTIAAYRTILLMLRQENNPQHYTELKRRLTEEFDRFAKEDVKQFFIFAFNYCIRQINQGNDDYQRELFTLYQQSLENGTIYEGDQLSEWDYKNITTIGCKLKEFDWTKKFIEDYKEKLPVAQQENAYNYSLAAFFFSKKSYEQAQSLLVQVHFTEVQYHLSGTFLLVRTYYELDNTEALLSLLETFRIYVMRSKKMTTKEKKGYFNLLRFTKKLVLLRNSSFTFSRAEFEKKLEALRQKIETTENTISRSWLLQECRNMEREEVF